MAGIEEFLYLKLMRSPSFHRFVRNIYCKINGINPHDHFPSPNLSEADVFFQPTRAQKFRAYRLLFYDEMRASFGLSRKHT